MMLSDKAIALLKALGATIAVLLFFTALAFVISFTGHWAFTTFDSKAILAFLMMSMGAAFIFAAFYKGFKNGN